MHIGKSINSLLSPLGLELKRKPPSADGMALSGIGPSVLPSPKDNPLREYFDQHKTGPGIWKWEHYFDIYHRHLSPFRNRQIHVLEIGIFSGGSLSMWSDYFGSESIIYGVDNQPACNAYEVDRIKISIGDQGDKAFWREFKRNTPFLDVVIDDGSHESADQIVAFKELFPHLRGGGVYICEDIEGRFSPFAAFASRISDELNAFGRIALATQDPNCCQRLKATDFQRHIEYIALHPFVAVFSKRMQPLEELVAKKHGTEWELLKYFDLGTFC